MNARSSGSRRPVPPSAARPSATRRRLLGAAGGALAMPALAQAPAVVRAPSPIKLRAATIVAESFPYVDGLRRWKALVEERTAGTVQIEVFHTAQLGDERSTNEGILTGTVHAGIGAGAWAGYVPAYNVVSLPFLLRDLPHMYALADGALGERLAALAEAKGFKVLGYYSGGDQHFQTRSKPIRSLADFKGLKIRVIENRAIVDGFRALGAVPAPIPYPQIYTALQQGTVDGTANDMLSVTTLRLYEVAKFYTTSSYLVEPRPLIMSKRFFDGLPKDIQQVLATAARESATHERKVYEERAASKRGELDANGMSVLTLSDRGKWVDTMRPIWDDFAKRTPDSADLIKAVLASS
ncbi:MAG TPA: TRAP transporter substrate-binding protein [Burkholderiaceae bacterium]|nr:TRAP transporter substrate-binding protein [Burkholderiaceae bacterium]